MSQYTNEQMAQACDIAGVMAVRDKTVPIEHAQKLNAAAATLRAMQGKEQQVAAMPSISPDEYYGQTVSPAADPPPPEDALLQEIDNVLTVPSIVVVDAHATCRLLQRARDRIAADTDEIDRLRGLDIQHQRLTEQLSSEVAAAEEAAETHALCVAHANAANERAAALAAAEARAQDARFHAKAEDRTVIVRLSAALHGVMGYLSNDQKFRGTIVCETAEKVMAEAAQWRVADPAAIARPEPEGKLPPYPEFCHTPDKCAGLGCCPRDPCCCD